MKTIAQLTIDELIDYCIDLRKSAQLYKELPVINSVFKERLDLITDEEEKDFYKTIIDDVILEIDNGIYCGDYELIKDKIINDNITNIDKIDQKLKQKIRVGELLNDELSTINVNLESFQYGLINSKEDFYSSRYSHDKCFQEIEFAWYNKILFDKTPFELPNSIGFRFELDTIGQFKKLEQRPTKEPNSLSDSLIDLCSKVVWEMAQNHITEIFSKRKTYSEAITCFEMVSGIIPAVNDMKYFKINTKEDLQINKVLRQRSKHKLFSNVRKSVGNKVSDKLLGITWFKLNLINDIDNFSYSDIYKSVIMNRQNITWFKRMDYNDHVENHCKIAYGRIDIDGSITTKEVAYFDTSRALKCATGGFLLNENENREQPSTLHYFVSNNDIDGNKDIPMLIGYSECSYMP